MRLTLQLYSFNKIIVLSDRIYLVLVSYNKETTSFHEV
jgi:hypothetical protein